MKSVFGRFAVASIVFGLCSTVTLHSQDTASVSTDMPTPAQIEAAALRANPKVDHSPPPGLFVKTFRKAELSAAAVARLEANQLSAAKEGTDVIKNFYMVSYQKGIYPYYITPAKNEEHLVDREGYTLEERADQVTRSVGGEVRSVHSTGDGAFSAIMSADQAKLVLESPGVLSVTPIRLGKFANGPTWAQDRINQASATRDYNYTTMNNGGSTVHMYFVGSGVRGTHQEFTGRIGTGESLYYPGDQSQAYTDVDAETSWGHETSVAGCAAGATYGVAPSAIIHSVRITNSAGIFNEDDVANGIKWVRDNRENPAVANLSVYVPPGNTTINNEVQALINAGVTVTVAAGNLYTNVLGSAAEVRDAITVGATDSSDAKAWFSNYGQFVDLYAPGYGVEMPTGESDAMNRSRDGTSFAAPIVAGVAALYLKGHPSATPEAVRNSIVANSTRGVVTSSGAGSRPDLVCATPVWLDTDQLKVAGYGTIVATNVQVGGNVIDHVLMTGSTVTVHSDNNQIVRVSWVDGNDDIVFAELSGPGNLKITLESASGPDIAYNYNQSGIYYWKGTACFEITGSATTSWFNVHSVGTANTSDQTIFRGDVSYDGFADIKNLTFVDTNSIGGILTGNARYYGSSGYVGIFSGPNERLVKVTNQLIVQDITSSPDATAAMILSPNSQFADSNGRPVIAGGTLIQYGGGKLSVRDGFPAAFSALTSTDNYNSHGVYVPVGSLAAAKLTYQYSNTLLPMNYYSPSNTYLGHTSDSW